MCDYCGCEARAERAYMRGLGQMVEDGELCPGCMQVYDYNEETDERECACNVVPDRGSKADK